MIPSLNVTIIERVTMESKRELFGIKMESPNHYCRNNNTETLYILQLRLYK